MICDLVKSIFIVETKQQAS